MPVPLGAFHLVQRPAHRLLEIAEAAMGIASTSPDAVAPLIRNQGKLMKTIPTVVLAFTALLSAGAASGQVANATTTVDSAKQTTCCADSATQMGQMDVHMERMQQLHAKLINATTPEERQKLMADQRREMHQGMAMMQAMPHDGSTMSGAGAGMKGHAGKSADPKVQMQMMERRMDMMQTMMQTMLDQQSAPVSSPIPAPAK
jgi:polyhydroxyalkanoate synthesis regulator protein